MIIYKCDFCGTEILKPNIITGLKDWECAEISLDLCDRCYRGLNSYVDKCFDAMGIINVFGQGCTCSCDEGEK